MNFVQTDELLRLMAGRKEDEEGLSEGIPSPISWTVHPERTQAAERFENNSNDDDEYAPLYDDLINPIASTGRSEMPQKPRPVDENADKLELTSCIRKVRTVNPSSKSKRSVSKAGGKKRVNRRKAKRQETKVTNRQKWTELVQNLMSLMRASKKGKKELDLDEQRQRKAAFRKRVTVLLVPFFKKPREQAAFLALLEAKEQCSRGADISQAKQVVKQTQEDETCEWKSGTEAFANNHSGQTPRTIGKKSVLWSMFSVDWDSTRVQRRRAARERAVLRHEVNVDNALTEVSDNVLERRSPSHQPMVQPKRNRAVELRRENERQNWRLLKEEIVVTILENIRIMAFFKKLCRPRLLAKLRQEAIACGANQSFDNFVAALPDNEDLSSWVGRGDKEFYESGEEVNEIVTKFLESNKKNAHNGSFRHQRCNTKDSHSTVLDGPLKGSSWKSESASTFSDISNQLEELGDVIRSALDDFDPE